MPLYPREAFPKLLISCFVFTTLFFASKINESLVSYALDLLISFTFMFLFVLSIIDGYLWYRTTDWDTDVDPNAILEEILDEVQRVEDEEMEMQAIVKKEMNSI